MDADEDDYGAGSQCTCVATGDYTATVDGDCDDARADVYPGAVESCDGQDEDCDGDVDEGAIDSGQWYPDADGDGFGAGAAIAACDDPGGYALDGTDCDDTDATVSPEDPERCGGSDENCDGALDVDAVDTLTWHRDADGDGFGDPASTVAACDLPSGYVADDTDCDDSDPAVLGGTVFYTDADGDGYGDPATGALACDGIGSGVTDATDCDDAEAGVNPGAAELGNAVDDDCDGEVDEGLEPDDTGHPPRVGAFWGGAACANAGAPLWLAVPALALVRRRRTAS